MSDRLDLWILRLAKLRRQLLRTDDTEARADFYESFFEDKDEQVYERDPRAVLRRNTIRRHLALPPGACVLDVGCGLGDVLAGLPEDLRRFGMDYSAANVRRVQRRLGRSAEVRQGSADAIPFDDASMDACLCLEVLEHLPDDAAAAAEIARVLKPGGVLIVSVPSTFYWPEYRQLIGHLRHYDRDSLASLLRGAGLDIDVHLPHYPNWHRRYTRGYVATRILASSAGRLLGCADVYRFHWPWQRQSRLERLAEKLEPLRQQDAQLDYSVRHDSTFVRAVRKRGSA